MKLSGMTLRLVFWTVGRGSKCFAGEVNILSLAAREQWSAEGVGVGESGVDGFLDWRL
jgi:hypothetical protein